MVGGSVPPTTAEGFLVPQPGAELSFPADHGSHPDYKIEWWYLTGHLAAESGREFGFQATFFRSALRPPEERADGGEAFGDDQLYLAHMAVTDVDGERFHHEERLNRGGWDADAAVGELDVRNGNWSLRALGEAAEHPMQLVFTVEDEVAVDLVLTPRKALLRFGEDGTSRKGADPTARSFYLTWSRLAAEGTVVLGEETLAVTGQAWMDHEIASQQLGDDLAGWDWTAIHLEDGWEVKAYILRREDGSPSPFSALMWIDPEGKVAYRGAEAFTWETAQWWTSPETGARYPVGVDLTTEDPRTGESITFALRPRLAAQELSTGSAGFAYWEGACTVQGAGGEHVGLAYLELVGYGGEATRGLR
ncbi:MAG: lipocalin-like domain-containing protein [Opitutales bacterium]